MSSVPSDTLKLATSLEKTGFNAEQAKGAASALAEALSDEMVTKSYLDNRIKDLQITIGGMIMALGGVLIAIKFFGH